MSVPSSMSWSAGRDMNNGKTDNSMASSSIGPVSFGSVGGNRVNFSGGVEAVHLVSGAAALLVIWGVYRLAKKRRGR